MLRSTGLAFPRPPLRRLPGAGSAEGICYTFSKRLVSLFYLSFFFICIHFVAVEDYRKVPRNSREADGGGVTPSFRCHFADGTVIPHRARGGLFSIAFSFPPFSLELGSGSFSYRRQLEESAEPDDASVSDVSLGSFPRHSLVFIDKHLLISTV